ncbi:N-terminal ig-like domain of cellulase [Sphingomonas guangdongensis]|uniref:N-terminal ig-like domain of cellulase n=1 Tax=Sphingomonas guangdongensis TaxID=1141890 RepID=A0A285QXI3_9SPHN|nr:glycoside hydrolase family 9 protein [Sphingomonas guangdongensis]SOB86536.1 N-terminal ig-like domain of cellulase [Sphingomonas guangdongensis]
MRGMVTMAAAIALAGVALPAAAQAPQLRLDRSEYFEAPGVNWLVFSNTNEGLFADAKISGVELIQQGIRTATNGDVRLAATPGQWDPAAQLVSRRVDKVAGVIEAVMAYSDFRYTVRAERRGGAVVLSVILGQALPAAMAGKAGLNLEFVPSAYFHHSFLADGRPGTFPLHPASGMVATAERNLASGRSDGPGAEPLPFASGRTLVLSPEDAARHVTITSSDGTLQLFDGRNQAQNGWFVVRQLLPAGRTGTVVQWTLEAKSVPGWLRPPVIAHSQLGYAPDGAKVATIELDRDDRRRLPVKLFRVEANGTKAAVPLPAPKPWGEYLRYRYLQADFSSVTRPGTYLLQYGDTTTAPFPIAPGLYDTAWHPASDVYLPVAMDHVAVNEAYRVWHGDAHRDDARQAPVNHEHIDLYRQGPTTDTKFAPGEHIPGLNVGGWLDAGDFDIRTQTQYHVIRLLADSMERWGLDRDTTWVDWNSRRVELHVPDGTPDLLQQVRHGSIQLLAQFDAVGHAIHGIVEPDVGQYTHLGDAASKTDGLVYDKALAPYQQRFDRDGGRSGTPDDRWAFTSKASALNYGSAAALAAAARVFKGRDDAFAAAALARAQKVWADEHSHAPDTFRHGNTTGGPLEEEEFAAAVELLAATRDQRYASRVAELYPKMAEDFDGNAWAVLKALPFMPPAFRDTVRPAAQAWNERATAMLKANPFGVPITTGGWAGSGAVMQFGLNAYLLNQAFPDLVDTAPVTRALDFIHGHHPAHDLSLVSGVGTRSKEVAYGSNRADFSYIAGGVVPGILILKPDYPENREDWPFFWGENEYVVPQSAMYIALVNAAKELEGKR